MEVCKGQRTWVEEINGAEISLAYTLGGYGTKVLRILPREIQTRCVLNPHKSLPVDGTLACVAMSTVGAASNALLPYSSRHTTMT